VSLRARLVLGAAAGLAASVVAVAAANATWRTVTTDAMFVTVDGAQVEINGPRSLAGTTQDGSLALFGIAGAAAALLAPMLAAKPRLGASALLAASGVMVASIAVLTRGLLSVPDAWVPGTTPGRVTFGAPTAAPLIAMLGGLGMIAAAVWLLTGARSAPRLSMPEGPPEQHPRDEGAWE